MERLSVSMQVPPSETAVEWHQLQAQNCLRQSNGAMSGDNGNSILQIFCSAMENAEKPNNETVYHLILVQLFGSISSIGRPLQESAVFKMPGSLGRIAT